MGREQMHYGAPMGCDLVRRDRERVELEAFDRLRAELKRTFAAPDDSYHALSASDVIHRYEARPVKPLSIHQAED